LTLIEPRQVHGGPREEREQMILDNFSDHMKKRKIDVPQFVEKDIAEVMQGKEFETLNDTQKEQIIAELHTRWSDPSSEIVNRMNSFAEKSPEILKPILES
jgi:hypothetical protein